MGSLCFLVDCAYYNVGMHTRRPLTYLELYTEIVHNKSEIQHHPLSANGKRIMEINITQTIYSELNPTDGCCEHKQNSPHTDKTCKQKATMFCWDV